MTERFNRFMEKINKEVEKIAGLGVYDLADVSFHDMYEDGFSPREAAIEALENEGFVATEEKT